MTILQQTRMCKSASRAAPAWRELVAHVWSTEAISCAGILGCRCAVLLLGGFDPSWYALISNRDVLIDPLVEVEVGLVVVIRNRVLWGYQITISASRSVEHSGIVVHVNLARG